MRVAFRIAACAAVLGAACSEDDGFSPPAGPPVAAANITIADNSFSPRTVLVSAGGTTTWAWSSGNVNMHNVIFTSGPNPPSGHTMLKATGTDYVATFSVAGQYNFHCSNHSGMTGAVFVE